MNRLLLVAFNQLNYVLDRTRFVNNGVWPSPQGGKLLSGSPFYSWNTNPNTLPNLECVLLASFVIDLFLTILSSSAILSVVSKRNHLLTFHTEKNWEMAVLGHLCYC